MVGSDVRAEFLDRGFVVLPSFLHVDEIAPARSRLSQLFPTTDEFHDDIDPSRNDPYRSEFGGITNFPFAVDEISLVAVHERLIDLAEGLLDTTGLLAYSIEAWAKYTEQRATTSPCTVTT